jgi:sucrose-phosphate synthase
MLLLIDRYDLHGSVAYPKQHRPDDVPGLYRLAAMRRGVFINPALTEPFGLTLIEAAASGLPIVATNDGGPKAIVAACKNGLLIDALDAEQMAAALLEVLSDRAAWRRRSRAGVRGAHGFSWQGHVGRYLKAVRRCQKKQTRRRPASVPRHPLVLSDHLIVCDIDNTLTGDREALAGFLGWLERHRSDVAFGIATGRVLKNTMRALREWRIPRPDVLITAVGSELYYGTLKYVEDVGWRRLIDRRWDPDTLRKILSGAPGLRLQPKADQRPHKLSYFIDPDKAPTVRELRRRIREAGLHANLIYSHEAYLDLLPARASKGGALRYLAHRWGLPLKRVLVAGDSGNDAEMLTSGARGVVVGNYSPELEKLRSKPNVYFAQKTNARGILEGIEHFGFTDAIERTDQPQTDQP